MFAEVIEPPKSDDDELFKYLKKVPTIAWPTVILTIAGFVVFYTSFYLGWTGQISLGVACLIKAISGYYLTTPIHDSVHGAVFRNKHFNDLFGHVVTMGYSWFGSFILFRRVHLRHHAYANDSEKDPDTLVYKGGINIFTVWFFWDFIFVYDYLKESRQRPLKEVISILLPAVVVLPIVITVFIAYPEEMFFLWFLPSRITNWLFACTSMYLPHYPHKVSVRENPFQSSVNIRAEKGEWLLDLVWANQNWHLSHHLYPRVPFYRYKKIWFARYHKHMKENPAVVSISKLRSYKQSLDKPE
jgi:fatty acid desaturase